MQERARRLQRTTLTTKKAYNQKPFSDSGKGFLLYIKQFGHENRAVQVLYGSDL